MIRRRSLLLGILSVALVAGSLAFSPAPAYAVTLKPGFNITRTTQPNIASLTNFAFLPNGSGTMLAIGKCGGLTRGTINGGWTTVSWPSQAAVYCEQGDRGLLGIAVDLSGATLIVYLLYDYTGGDGRIYGRLSKYSANSAEHHQDVHDARADGGAGSRPPSSAHVKMSRRPHDARRPDLYVHLVFQVAVA